MKKRIASVLAIAMLFASFPAPHVYAKEADAAEGKTAFVADASIDVVLEVRVLSEDGDDITDDVPFLQRAYITLPGIDERPVRADLKSEEAHGNGYSSGLPFDGFRIPYDSKKVKKGVHIEPFVALTATEVDSPYIFQSSEIENISKDEGNEFHYLITLTVRVPEEKKRSDAERNSISKTRDEIKTKLDPLKKKAATLREELEVLNARKSTVQSSFLELKKSAENAAERKTKNRSEIEEKYEELKALKIELKSMIDKGGDQSPFQEATNHMFALRDALSSLRESDLSLRIEAEREKNAYDGAVRELQSLQNRLSAKEKEMEELDAEIQELEENFAEVDGEKTALEAYDTINEAFNKARREKNRDELKSVLLKCLKAYQETGEREDLWELLNRIYYEWAQYYSKEERKLFLDKLDNQR